MKILQLTSSLAIGGVTSVVSNLSHALKHDHDVTIGCYKPYTDEITIDTDGLTIELDRYALIGMEMIGIDRIFYQFDPFSIIA